MPNHVYINMEVNGKSKEVDAFFDNHVFVDSEGNNLFDFNSFIPMPPELKDTTFPVNVPSNRTVSELAEWENARQKLVEKYGADNWYEWAIDNWGTKWNAYDVQVNHDIGMISFCTAWSMPMPIFNKIAEMYPNLDFHFEIVEEGGFFAGTVDIQDGVVHYNITENNEEWKQYAAEFMGWDVEFDE